MLAVKKNTGEAHRSKLILKGLHRYFKAKLFYEIGDMNAKIEASQKISDWNFITNKIEEIFDLKKAAMRLFLTFKVFIKWQEMQ